jgi:hypothetical protein
MDNFSISVVSIPVVDAIVADAVHHEILFRNESGQVIVSFNGMPFEKASGGLAHYTYDGEGFLKAMTYEDTILDFFKTMDGVIENKVFEGSAEEIVLKMLQAEKASQFINEHNIDYIGYGVIGHSQNSNSVAVSLLRAMGVEVPPEVENLWAPGFERDLLPVDWKPFGDNPDVTELLDPRHDLRKNLELDAISKVIKNMTEEERHIGRSEYFVVDDHQPSAVSQEQYNPSLDNSLPQP